MELPNDSANAAAELLARHPEAQIRIDRGEDGDWSVSLWQHDDDVPDTLTTTGMRLLGQVDDDSIGTALATLNEGMDER